MIVKLTYTNNLPIPVQVYTNQGTAQPLVPRQSLEMTFSMVEDADGTADLIIRVEPSP